MISIIGLYLADIGEPNYPTADEERELFRNRKKNKEKILKAYARMVAGIARKYTKGPTEFEDLLQEGNIGLLRAITTFDPDKEARFTTYAWYWIRQAVIRSSQKASTIRLPTNRCDKLQNLLKIRDKLLLELEHEPNIRELSEASELPEDLVFNILQAYNPVYSLDHPINTGADDADTIELRDAIADPSNYEFGLEIDKELLSKMISLLSKREQAILFMHFGLGTKYKSFDEIGKIMGITRERVRQIEASALRKLRVYSQRSEFKALTV